MANHETDLTTTAVVTEALDWLRTNLPPDDGMREWLDTMQPDALLVTLDSPNTAIDSDGQRIRESLTDYVLGSEDDDLDDIDGVLTEAMRRGAYLFIDETDRAKVDEAMAIQSRLPILHIRVQIPDQLGPIGHDASYCEIGRASCRERV